MAGGTSRTQAPDPTDIWMEEDAPPVRGARTLVGGPSAPMRETDRRREADMDVTVDERRTGVDRLKVGAKTRLILVDAHTLFRRGVRQILVLEPVLEGVC